MDLTSLSAMTKCILDLCLIVEERDSEGICLIMEVLTFLPSIKNLACSVKLIVEQWMSKREGG